jgi:hypothetical protein
VNALSRGCADVSIGTNSETAWQCKQRPRKVPEKPGSKLERLVQIEIGRALRDAYADVAEEPVPERFVRLLEALEAKETNR